MNINNHRKNAYYLFWLFTGMALGSMFNFDALSMSKVTPGDLIMIDSWLTTLSLLGLAIFFYAYSLLGDEFIKMEEKRNGDAK